MLGEKIELILLEEGEEEEQTRSRKRLASTSQQGFCAKRNCSEVVWRTTFVLLLLICLWNQILQIFCRHAVLVENPTSLPSYVLEYAPLVYLDKKETFFPSDLSAQLSNTTPLQNFTAIIEPTYPLTLHNLQTLNSFGSDIYLTSNLDITTLPAWLSGVRPSRHRYTSNATTSAVITVPGSAGRLDAFYMYFYAYNRGNTVFGRELGDHVGDWEHNMIRFQDGVPQAVWYSQHNNGEAFTYEAVEKMGKRPVMYSARGSHACYATAGTHDHSIPDLNLPNGFLRDYTSAGPLWDPLLSAYFYEYSPDTEEFEAADEEGTSPTGAMYYKGKWGDDEYPQDDPRQSQFFGFKKFVGGPTGPRDKQLVRKGVCPDNGFYCFIRGRLGP